MLDYVNPFGLLIVAFGAFSAAGGFYNWQWFMNSSRARFVSTFLGRTGARIFYVILGVALIVLGAPMTFNAIR